MAVHEQVVCYTPTFHSLVAGRGAGECFYGCYTFEEIATFSRFCSTLWQVFQPGNLHQLGPAKGIIKDLVSLFLLSCVV
ncbi:hypothetical protein [Acetomicrobium sp.]|uniref:hypothetical protein n=1 Tax=Acetomicrobium sp. TaxID=1872099 RepID=UPI002BCE5D3F|nr:hypothetical protein [Acetomicrobium sp.]HQC88156.1 hypothetical protein [Acetomicrobium sp.]